jgi:hypothetical protein
MPFLFELERRTNIQTYKRKNEQTNKHEHLHFTPFSYYSKLSQVKVVKKHRLADLLKLRKKENKKKDETRTAWAVFKYCGTKTVPLRMKKKL